MFSEIITSIKASLYDRVTSPLFGAFTISALLINYQTVLLIFDGQEFFSKIDYIESTLYSDWYVALLKLFILPAASALIFIFIYPIPARFTYQFWLGQQKKLKEIKVQIENETPLTREESRKLRRQLTVLEDEFNNELREKEKEIDDLKSEIIELDKERRSTQDELNKALESAVWGEEDQKLENSESDENETPPPGSQEEIDQEVSAIDSEKNIEEFFKYAAGATRGVAYLRYIADQTGLSPIRVETIAVDLQELGLGKLSVDHDNDQFFVLTSEGKRFALRRNYA